MSFWIDGLFTIVRKALQTQLSAFLPKTMTTGFCWSLPLPCLAHTLPGQVSGPVASPCVDRALSHGHYPGVLHVSPSKYSGGSSLSSVLPEVTPVSSCQCCGAPGSLSVPTSRTVLWLFAVLFLVCLENPSGSRARAVSVKSPSLEPSVWRIMCRAWLS